jgi:hypothetical protein
MIEKLKTGFAGFDQGKTPMIRVLVIANESLMAEAIVATLSQQADMEVIRRSRDELGQRSDYSVVVIVDEGIAEQNTIQRKEIIQDDRKPLLLIRVSLQKKVVNIDESYELINPGTEQLVDLVRDFGRKHTTRKAIQNADRQKKMTHAGELPAEKHKRQTFYFPFKNFFSHAAFPEPEDQTTIRTRRLPLFEARNSLVNFSFQLRRRISKNVTLSIRKQFISGGNKV